MDFSSLPGILRANNNARNSLAIPKDGFRYRTIYEEIAPISPPCAQVFRKLASLKFLQANLDHTRAATAGVLYIEAEKNDFAVVWAA